MGVFLPASLHLYQRIYVSQQPKVQTARLDCSKVSRRLIFLIVLVFARRIYTRRRSRWHTMLLREYDRSSIDIAINF
ncbi:hypothetical protein LIPSTDRAFT_71677 [Lipomyces starkeyi NRRL Y-11557]|uniref:Uncharacterized protein n=1 Tax=Lipomyces starkeyi NRRL Y-11557 TaxID=675824 RepID=A0A1E3Q6T9_LIPST|nr:hypothetical protein LIPSTDRAFT_71677 [Lipomyces starkeyi NRRL Y-11557]